MTNIAFIGLGAMGLLMAKRLAAKGIELSVYDIVLEHTAEMKGSARIATSIADAIKGADGIFSVGTSG